MTIEDVWKEIRPLILPYEGGASQIHVLDIPETERARVIDNFAAAADQVTISSLNSYCFGATPLEFNASNRSKLLATDEFCILRGVFSGNQSIQFWILPDEKAATFDAEFVFFADEFFGDETDQDRLLKSFRTVFDLAEKSRLNHPDCECAFTISEGASPRTGRGESWTHFW